MKAALLAFLALFLVASPVLAKQAAKGVVTLPPVTEIVTGDDSSPGLKCPEGKFCVFTYPFNEHISEESVGKFQRYVQMAKDAGGKAILLELNSPGGSVSAGHTMARTMEISSMRFVCVVDGYTASAAFYALQSCDYRYATKRSVLMTHNVLLKRSCDDREYEVTLSEAKDMVDEMTKLSDSFAEHVLSRAKNIGKAEYLKRIEHGDWTMTPDEALHYGFIDKVWPGIPNSIFAFIREHGQAP